MDKQKTDTVLVVRINKYFREEYKNYCNEQGFTMSKRIITLLKNDLNGKITINKL